jgi:osmotically inducible protein OsmC
MATRNGTAEWRGDLQGGGGELAVGSGLFSGKYSFKTRFEDEPGTNPEELIGAAHAACYSMAFSNMLSEAGHVPASVKTTAKVHLRIVDGAPTINQIDLVTEGTVPGIDQATFEEIANQAKAGCPVSRALAAVGEITLQATLTG